MKRESETPEIPQNRFLTPLATLIKPVCFALMIWYIICGLYSSQRDFGIALGLFWPCMVISVLLEKWQKSRVFKAPEFLILNVILTILISFFAGNNYRVRQQQFQFRCSKQLLEIGRRLETQKLNSPLTLSEVCPASGRAYSLTLLNEGGFEIRCLGDPHTGSYGYEGPGYPRYTSGVGVVIGEGQVYNPERK